MFCFANKDCVLQMDELNLFVDLTLSISEVRDQVDNVADVILSHSR